MGASTAASGRPTVSVGHEVFGGVAADPARHLVYVADGLDDTVSVIDGATCDSTNTTGCAQAPPTVPGGPQPAAIAIYPLDGNVYGADNGGGIVTFFRFIAPDQPTDLTATRSGNSITLSWNRSYAGGLPIIDRVLPSPACPSCQGLSTLSTSGLPDTTVTGLKPGTAYTFTSAGWTVPAPARSPTHPSSMRSRSR